MQMYHDFSGFDNFYDLHHLRMLSVANCARINDWTLSRIGSMFSESLELLDLSNCKRISGKGEHNPLAIPSKCLSGLIGLQHLKNLKCLRLEGLDKVPDIAKSALLLEEAIPGGYCGGFSQLHLPLSFPLQG